MKRYIRSDTYFVHDGQRYQLYEDNESNLFLYDSDSSSRTIIEKLTTKDFEEAKKLKSNYNQSRRRVHTYIHDIFNYCKSRNDGSSYTIFPDYIQYVPATNTQNLHKKLKSFRKSHPNCKIKVRQGLEGDYFIYQM